MDVKTLGEEASAAVVNIAVAVFSIAVAIMALGMMGDPLGLVADLKSIGTFILSIPPLGLIAALLLLVAVAASTLSRRRGPKSVGV